MTKLRKQIFGFAVFGKAVFLRLVFLMPLTAFTSLVLIKEKGYFQESDQPSPFL